MFQGVVKFIWMLIFRKIFCLMPFWCQNSLQSSTFLFMLSGKLENTGGQQRCQKSRDGGLVPVPLTQSNSIRPGIDLCPVSKIAGRVMLSGLRWKCLNWVRKYSSHHFQREIPHQRHFVGWFWTKGVLPKLIWSKFQECKNLKRFPDFVFLTRSWVLESSEKFLMI